MQEIGDLDGCFPIYQEYNAIMLYSMTLIKIDYSNDTNNNNNKSTQA